LLPRIGFVLIGGIGAAILNAIIGAVILLSVGQARLACGVVRPLHPGPMVRDASLRDAPHHEGAT